MPVGAPPTPEEMQEVMARDVAQDIRLAARLQGKSKRFHDAEQLSAFFYEVGLIDYDLYKKITSSRWGFKNMLPAQAAMDYIKAVSESKNPTPLLAMVSQTVGAKKIGNEVVPIRREDIPGLASKDLIKLIRDPVVRRDLTFEGGMEILEVVASKKMAEGSIDQEAMQAFVDASKAFRKALQSLVGEQDVDLSMPKAPIKAKLVKPAPAPELVEPVVAPAYTPILQATAKRSGIPYKWRPAIPA